MATMSFSMEEISPPTLAQTPMEKPSSTGSPIFCSYSTSSPSETSGVAGFSRPPPRGRFTPEILPTRETMPSSGQSVSILGVLLALPAAGDQEEGVGHPPHVGVARSQLLDSHIVQVRPAVQNREVAGVLDVEARDPQYLATEAPIGTS